LTDYTLLQLLLIWRSPTCTDTWLHCRLSWCKVAGLRDFRFLGF